MAKSETNSKICIFDSNSEVAESISQQWLTLSKRDTVVHISLSGGSTPKYIFEFIAQSHFAKQINWHNLHFWWGDERCVSAKNEQSNYGEAMRLLFSHVLIPADNLHPIHGELSPEKAAIEFKDEMEACLPMSVIDGNMRPIFDWIILGVGDDGHTASLFANKTDYKNAQNALLAYHPETKQARVTISASVICAAKRVTYLALGTGKKEIVAAILNNEPLAENLPAAKIMSTQGLTEWYLDQPSASALQHKNNLS